MSTASVASTSSFAFTSSSQVIKKDDNAKKETSKKQIDLIRKLSITPIEPKKSNFEKLPGVLKFKILSLLPGQLITASRISKSTKAIADNVNLWLEIPKTLDLSVKIAKGDEVTTKEVKRKIVLHLKDLNEYAFATISDLYFRKALSHLKDPFAKWQFIRDYIRSSGITNGNGLILISRLPIRIPQPYVLTCNFNILDCYIASGFSDKVAVWEQALSEITYKMIGTYCNDFVPFEYVLFFQKLIKAFQNNSHIDQTKKDHILQNTLINLLVKALDKDTSYCLLGILWALEAGVRPSDTAIKNLLTNVSQIIKDEDLDGNFQMSFNLNILLRLQIVCNFLKEEQREELVTWLDSLPSAGNKKTIQIITNLLRNVSLLTLQTNSNFFNKGFNDFCLYFMVDDLTYKDAIVKTYPFSPLLHLYLKSNIKTEKDKQILLEMLDEPLRASKIKLPEENDPSLVVGGKSVVLATGENMVLYMNHDIKINNRKRMEKGFEDAREMIQSYTIPDAAVSVAGTQHVLISTTQCQTAAAGTSDSK